MPPLPLSTHYFFFNRHYIFFKYLSFLVLIIIQLSSRRIFETISSRCFMVWSHGQWWNWNQRQRYVRYLLYRSKSLWVGKLLFLSLLYVSPFNTLCHFIILSFYLSTLVMILVFLILHQYILIILNNFFR